MYVSKSDNLNQIVSRQSGLRSDRGTFGGNVRFSAKKLMSPTGKDSPWEDKYCNVTIKQKTKVTVGAVSPHEEARKPGPGTYTLHSEINGGYVSRGDKKNWVGPPAPKMGIALREVHDYQGDALYNVAQDLGSSLMYFKDPKKSSTFGFAKLGASYYPVTSCAKTTSPLDGFTTRNLSPVTQFGKISSLKMKSMTSVSPTK
eukprot:g8922.t1